MRQSTYQYQQEENGNLIAINERTGEITGATTLIVPFGTRVYTPEDQERYRQKKETEQKKELRKAANKALGRFYFVENEADFSGLSPATITRLIFLGTFAHYDGQLMRTERTLMKRRDLPAVLGISKAAVSKFWQEVSPNLLIEKNGNLIIPSDSPIRKGKIASIKGHSWRKFYIDAVRALYRQTDKSQHKHLAYIFALLPHINIEFNIVCHNIQECNLDAIESMTLSEFCAAIGYDSGNFNRLLAIYRELRFSVGDHLERFVSFVYDGLDRSQARIFVNPHVLYSGTNYKQVEILGSFCK